LASYGFELRPGPLKAQNDGAALVETDEVEVFLPMSMPRTRTVSLEWRGMAGSLLLVTPPRGGTAGGTAGPFH